MKFLRAVGVAMTFVLAGAAGCKRGEISDGGSGAGGTRAARSCGVFRHGERETRTRYLEAVVPAEASCVSETQTRTCNDGTLSPWTGTYVNPTCSPPSTTGISLVPPSMTSGTEATPSAGSAYDFNGSLVFAGTNGRGVQKTFRYNRLKNEVTELPSTSTSSSKNDSASLFVRFNGQLYFTAYGSTGQRGIFRYSAKLDALETVIMTSNKELFAIQDLKVLGNYLYVRIANTAGEFPGFFRIDTSDAITKVAPWDQTPLATYANGIPYDSELTAIGGKFYYSGLKILPGTAAGSRTVTIGGTAVSATGALFEYSPATATVRDYSQISSSLVIKGVLGTRLVVEALGRNAVYLLTPATGRMALVPNAPASISSMIPYGSSLIFSGKSGARNKLYEMKTDGKITPLDLYADVPLCGQTNCFYTPAPFFVHANYLLYSDDGRNGNPPNSNFAKNLLPATNGAHRLRVYNFGTGRSDTLLGTGYKLVNFGGFAGTPGFAYFYAADAEFHSRYYRWDLNGRPDLFPTPAPSPTLGLEPQPDSSP